MMSKLVLASVRIAALTALTFSVIMPYEVFAQIDEVVVTTRRRAENLQDVPIAVSAITTEQIQRQGISDLKDVVQNQPSVQFDQSFGPSDNRITIRGLSNTRGRSNVAFLIDGIDVTTENLIVAGSGLLANRRLLTDVERIEIVKGPQSALFGRAAFAGALSYTTKEPTDEFQGRVSLDLGDYGRRTIDGGFGGPLTDTLGVRITGVRFNEDGYYTNTASGQQVGGNYGYGAALTTVWKPDDVLKIKGRIEYSEENFDPRAVVNVQGDTPYFIPENAKALVRPIITGNPLTQAAGSSGTNLFNFGTYCPKLGSFPSNQGAPGFCLPRVISKPGTMQVALSEDPDTGRDYPGTDTETFRASLIASADLGYGVFSSYTGWTDFEAFDNYDQDYQASTEPDYNGNGSTPYSYASDGSVLGGRRDTLLGAQEASARSFTSQFSQEFRFQTDWDFPVKFTGGVLFWQDHRSLEDTNWITSCAPFGRQNATQLQDGDGNPVFRDADGDPNTPGLAPVTDPTTGTIQFVSGVCDGLNNTFESYQDLRRQVGVADPGNPQLPLGQVPQIWDTRTRHLSFYGMAEWTISDQWKFTAETRLVDEESYLLKPGGSGCTEIGFASNTDALSPWRLANSGSNVRVICDNERFTYGIGPFPTDAGTGGFTWRYIEGSTYSRYSTPKFTLAWTPVDDTNIYLSYGVAKKPGGINALTGGGAAEPPPISAERFDPEELKAYELGLKTDFEFAGYWRFNSSVFFQDYTDKQVSIQVLSPEGIAQPRVVNASGAEVKGFEFEATWQPDFMEGLTLGLSGTILDPTYTNWTDDTRNLVRVAAYGSCPLVWKGANGDESSDPDSIIAQTATSQVFCRLSYAGNTLERTPKQAYSASMQIQRPFLDTEYEYLFELSGKWEDKRWAEPENLVQFGDYALLDLRVGLTSDTWEVVGYVDNVLDSDRIQTGGSGPDFGQQVTQLGFTAGFGTTHYFASLADPRVFGIRARYSFGSGR
jgi:iron complex outermembrane recepter protein